MNQSPESSQPTSREDNEYDSTESNEDSIAPIEAPLDESADDGPQVNLDDQARREIPHDTAKYDYMNEAAYDYGGREARRKPSPYLLLGLIGVLAVIAVVAVGYFLGVNSQPTAAPSQSDVGQQAPTLAPSGSATESGLDNRPGTFIPSEGTTHVKEGTPIAYKSHPPSSGTHFGVTGDYGFHEEEVPEGKLVHSLEHGAIVIYYKPDIQADKLKALRDTYDAFPPAKYGKVKLVIAPYPNMQTPIAIAAWTRVQMFSGFDRDGLLKFYQALVDKGPEDVP